MEYFRFVPPTIVSMATVSLLVNVASCLPMPQNVAPVPQTRFLPGLIPQFNNQQQTQNLLAGGGLAGAGAFAASNCLFNNNCDLSFRPSLGAAVDANGQIVPQLGLTTQVGSGPIAPTFTAGAQLDGNSQNGIGGFVAGGVNTGGENGISPGVQTGFSFGQDSSGQTQATAQVGGNIQAPTFGGVNFGQQGQPGSIGGTGVQPVLFNQPLFSLLGGR